MTKVLYPGSFDPITKGHMDIIDKASKMFDEVIVAVLHNSNKKNCFFTIDERTNLIKDLYKDYDNIKVISSTKTCVDVALEYNLQIIIKGLRNTIDFEYEREMAEINKDISNNKINTMCLFSDKEYQFISSSIVKEIFHLDKDISKYVHPLVKERMESKKHINKIKTNIDTHV